MSADEMEIINPNTSGTRFVVGSDNQVEDKHDCTFAGDHSTGLDVNDSCTICGKTLGDFIAEDFDPTKTHIPIILVPQGGQ